MSVLQDGGFATVGDLLIAAIQSDDGYLYSHSIVTSSGPLTACRPADADGWVNVTPPTSGAQGTYTETILTPQTPGIGLAAVFISEAEHGAVYWTSVLSAPEGHHARIVEEFRDIVESEYGVAIHGGFGR